MQNTLSGVRPGACPDQTDLHNEPCGLAAGTPVLTAAGAVPVENLRPGDRIVTRDGGMRALRQVSSRVVGGVCPVRIRASALGHGRPGADVLLGPGQRLLLRDWRARAMFGQGTAMVPVARLIDGIYIARLARHPNLRLYTLEFDAAHVIYAEGLELGIEAL